MSGSEQPRDPRFVADGGFAGDRGFVGDGKSGSDGEYVSKVSPLGVADTVTRLRGMIEDKGMTLFAVIDQRAEALRVGLDLRETVLVLFGNPVAGTPVMAAFPLAALDLPLRVLVWADGEQTRVSYPAPAVLAARHHLGFKLASTLAAVDSLTDELVASAPTV